MQYDQYGAKLLQAVLQENSLKKENIAEWILEKSFSGVHAGNRAKAKRIAELFIENYSNEEALRKCMDEEAGAEFI